RRDNEDEDEDEDEEKLEKNLSLLVLQRTRCPSQPARLKKGSSLKQECIVLGRDFKLLNDANVLLRTPRQHNMYTIDLNNIVSHKDLTFLVAKASADEVTDDFSRFTWTFFLKTKDETSGIIRKFISEIENLKDLKVKIIKYDNGGEFQNKEMDDFCSQKGIKREFSNARTPQQNGVAERRNRTLIEAARIMLADAKLPVTFWAEAVNTACYVKNRRTKRVEESLHVEFLENKTIEKGVGPNWLFDIKSLTKSMNYVPVVAGTNSTNISGTKDAASQEVKKDVSSLRYIALPTWVYDALLESSSRVRPIGTKWVLKNKKDERGIVIKNNARLVAQGHTQEEGIDYDEVFAPVVRIEAIRLFLAYASFMRFTVYQMDVNSAFLYGTIDEEVEFEALMHEKFQMSAMGELNFFLGESLGKDGTGKDVDLHLYRSMIGSLMYLTASRPDIMFAVCAYARHQVTHKECHLHAVKRIFRYLKGHPKLGLWYPKESPFDLVAYSDSNYGGATRDRKSTTGGCQFLGRRIISWQCKKQTIMAT
nr:hypothetical protein [Tanacetum cinerariifolium]